MDCVVATVTLWRKWVLQCFHVNGIRFGDSKMHLNSSQATGNFLLLLFAIEVFIALRTSTTCNFLFPRIASEISSIFNHIRFPNLKKKKNLTVRRQPELDHAFLWTLQMSSPPTRAPNGGARALVKATDFEYNYNESITSPHLWLLWFIERCACELWIEFCDSNRLAR